MRPDDDSVWTSPAELATLKDWAGGRINAVEVGTWKGRSAEAIAQGQGKNGMLYCVDDFSGDPAPNTRNTFFPQSMTPEGQAEVQAEWAARMEPYLHRVKLLAMPSVDAARSFDDASLDLIFIDGAHDYLSVSADLEAWARKLKKGGRLCGHDWDQPAVLRALKERFPFQIEFGPEKLWRKRDEL